MKTLDRAAMPYRDCVGTAVFNREGKVQHRKLGALKAEDLAQWAKALS